MPKKNNHSKPSGQNKQVTDLREKGSLLLSNESDYVFLVSKAKSLNPATVTPKNCAHFYGVDYSTLDHWKSGKIKTCSVRESTLNAIIETFNENIQSDLFKETALKLSPNEKYFEPLNLKKLTDLNKYEFGAQLGFGWKTVQKNLDIDIYFKNKRSSLIIDEDVCDKITHKLPTFYLVWHLSLINRNDSIVPIFIRSLLEIRHTLAFEDGTTMCRCKWSMPITRRTNQNGDDHFYKYEGSLTTIDTKDGFGIYYWLFESQSAKNASFLPDLTYFTTHRRKADSKVQEGFYTSKNVDECVYTSSLFMLDADYRDGSGHAIPNETIAERIQNYYKYKSFIDNFGKQTNVFFSREDAISNAATKREKEFLQGATFCSAINDEGKKLFFLNQEIAQNAIIETS